MFQFQCNQRGISNKMEYHLQFHYQNLVEEGEEERIQEEDNFQLIINLVHSFLKYKCRLHLGNFMIFPIMNQV